MRLALFVLIGCSQTSSATLQNEKPVAPTTPPPMAAPEPSPALVAQITQGKQLYVQTCAECHGATLEGTGDGPALAGKHVLPLEPRADSKRGMQFRTAGDVYAFAAQNMPADDPGSLAPEQYQAIIAFVLGANGVRIERPFDTASAQTIALRQ
ncbi:MAG TPA: cytochrome c [Kofleriaceae bacterium]